MGRVYDPKLSVSSKLRRLAAHAMSIGSSLGTMVVFKTQRIKHSCLLACVHAVLKMLGWELAKIMGTEIIS